MAKAKNGDVVEYEKDKGPSDWGPAAGEPLLTAEVSPSGVRQMSPGQPPVIVNPAVIDTVEAQALWLADAKEIERVLLAGDHASPVRTAQLLAEAIPVVEAWVPPVTRSKKSEKDEDEREGRDAKKEEKRER